MTLFMRFNGLQRFVIFGFILFLSACTIQKRNHLPGYHVTWKNAGVAGGKNSAQLKETGDIKMQDQLANTETFAFVENDLAELQITNDLTFKEGVVLEKNHKHLVKPNDVFQKKTTKLNVECDIITLKNGSEIRAKVLEVGAHDIRYKECDNLDGPIFTIAKRDVFMIKYPNGSKTMINEQHPSDSWESNTSLDIDKHVKTFETEDKSFLVAAVLWFFLGLIGIHRFYLGHIGMGILYLCTAGLCGIGWIIDGILLATGGLKPKNGRFIDQD